MATRIQSVEPIPGSTCVARRPGQALYMTPNGLGQIHDEERDIWFHPANFDSLVARGYWEPADS